MDQNEIRIALDRQRLFFISGRTLDVQYRIDILKKIRSLIKEHEEEIKEALWKDFHKPVFEVVATETQFIVKELNLAIRRLKRWSKPKRVRTPIVHFLASSFVTKQPYGQVLILSPWNYPFQLAFVPLIGAIAAGNCVVLKTSQQVPSCNIVIEKILGKLPGELIMMTKGDHAISEYLLGYKFDYIFFTGSSKIGKHVMKKASENLIPISLELGGKNPCVIAADAKLDFAARRIAWGKFMNAGQTCICTDYILIDKKIREKFLEALTREIRSFYGEDPQQSKDYARMISKGNVERISAFLNNDNIVTGGSVDIESCFVSPTVLKKVGEDDPVMQEEIFGPVLPVIDFDNFEKVYDIISRHPKPLAVYIFTRDRKLAKEFLQRTQSGTAAINDTVLQIASPYLPYGGVGKSGTGRYHGRKSFETFSNMRSVLIKSNLLDLTLRYPPYSRLKERIINLLMR
jgi:aldehyde dehydrogenase (NAD+)